MSSASVSRSGRVRKPPAKLMEMVTELSGHHTSENHTKGAHKTTPIVAQDNTPLTDTPIVSSKKNLKVRLSLNPSPTFNSEDEANESESKKSMVPILKIPKSKIKGLTPKVVEPTIEEVKIEQMDHEIDDNNDISNVPTVEVTIPHDYCDEELEDKQIEESYEEVEEEEVKWPIHETQAEPTVTPMKIDLKSLEQPIVETPIAPKEAKPKKKEAESAANKLFRQITSGVATNSVPKAKSNKRKKSSPLEVVTQNASTFEDEYTETSLVIATEDNKPKPKNVRTRPSKPINDSKLETKRTKRTKKEGDDKPKKKRNAVITAYMIWSKEYRSKIQQDCPDLDFADVSRKLGEIWQSMPEKERIPWRRKAQKLVAKGSSIISTGKPRAISQNAKISNSPISANQAVFNSDDYSNTSIEDLWEPIGTSPMDVSAHLTLLGESLSIIGQRLKEHNGQIAVSGSLSVLLDSTLCAIGPLLCLTQLHPSLDGCYEETHKKTLDNIAYIMPGI